MYKYTTSDDVTVVPSREVRAANLRMDRDISDFLTKVGDNLASRATLSSSEAAALHSLRLAARLLFAPRDLRSDWHAAIHELFDTIEVPQQGKPDALLSQDRAILGRALQVKE